MTKLTKHGAERIYQTLGPSVLLELAQTLGHREWGYCAACECDVPTIGKDCLLCGQTTTDNEERLTRSLTLRELSTILAALRFWQREGLASDGHETKMAEEHGKPLTADDIDDLCACINVNGVTTTPAPRPEPSTRDAENIVRLAEKALEEISNGDPVKAEAHLTGLLALVRPERDGSPAPAPSAETPEAFPTVPDAVEIVLKLARAQLADSPEPDAQGLSREACNVVEDYAVNHLGDE